MKQSLKIRQLKKIGFAWNHGFISEFSKYSDEILWSNNLGLLHELIKEKQSNLTIFPLDFSRFNKYCEYDILRPLKGDNIKEINANHWKVGLSVLKRKSVFYGIPEDIGFYGVMVPLKEFEESSTWNWNKLRTLINDNYKNNGINFWSSSHTNNMGLIFSILGAHGIDINAPLVETINLKENWLTAYEWLNSLEWDWSEIFNNKTSLLDFKYYSPKPKLEMGWSKIPLNPYSGYEDHAFCLFPQHPIAKKRYDLCVGSCWASIKNKIDDQTINDLFKIILDYKNIKKRELKSPSYFSTNKKIWKDTSVLEAKPLYKHLDVIKNIKSISYLNINSKHYGDVREIFAKSLTNKANNDIFFSYLERLVTTGKTFYQTNELQTAVEYINANYQQIKKVKDIAHQLSCSESHLQRLFKKTFNCSCWEYLLRARIEHAKNELAYSTHTINDISAKTGFKNSTTFTRVFKKVTGLTPSAFKTSKKNKIWE